MEKKRCKVVMLPTGFRNSDIQLGLEGGYIYYKTNCIDERTRYQHLYITSDDKIEVGDWVVANGTPYPVLEINPQGEFRTALCWISNVKKVIATTDSFLFTKCNSHKNVDGNTKGKCPFCKSLPQIPQAFIEEYCRKGGIDEVDVEYEKYHDGNFINDGKTHAFTALLRPEVSNDNIINIHPIKDTYTRDEVIQKLHDIVNDSHCKPERIIKPNSNKCAEFVLNWIKEKL